MTPALKQILRQLLESNIEHTGWELRPVWRSREEGPGGSSGIPTRCQALPGAWPGILKQKDRVPDVREEPVCVCVCARVCVKCGIRVLCVFGGVVCACVL